MGLAPLTALLARHVSEASQVVRGALGTGHREVGRATHEDSFAAAHYVEEEGLAGAVVVRKHQIVVTAAFAVHLRGREFPTVPAVLSSRAIRAVHPL